MIADACGPAGKLLPVVVADGVNQKAYEDATAIESDDSLGDVVERAYVANDAPCVVEAAAAFVASADGGSDD